MRVSIQKEQPKNPTSTLFRGAITTAKRLNPTQCVINWPPGADTLLSITPDEQWTERPADWQVGTQEICNILPQGFEYNPQWPTLGSPSIIIPGRVLAED